MIEHTFDTTGPADLDISLPSGTLVVEAGEPETVNITIDTIHAESWRVHHAGNAVSVWQERGMISRGGRARVRLVVPPGSSLKASTASADIRTEVDLDRVSVATASGEVSLRAASSLTVKSASGDIVVGSVGHELTVRTASGDVRVSTVGGNAALTTASGDLLVETAHGSLSGSTASGDLHVGAYLGDDVEVSTMSGDIAVGLPTGRRVRLKANTLSGSVRLPERRPDSGEPSSHTVSVSLKSVSGDIIIRRLG